MRRLFLVDPGRFANSAHTFAEQHGIWTRSDSFPSVLKDPPRLTRMEFVVGDATLGFASDEVVSIVEQLSA